MPETKQAASSYSSSNMQPILASILTTLVESFQNLPVNAGIVFQIKPSFPIHYCLVMQLFRATNNIVKINHKLEAVYLSLQTYSYMLWRNLLPPSSR